MIHTMATFMNFFPLNYDSRRKTYRFGGMWKDIPTTKDFESSLPDVNGGYTKVLGGKEAKEYLTKLRNTVAKCACGRIIWLPGFVMYDQVSRTFKAEIHMNSYIHVYDFYTETDKHLDRKVAAFMIPSVKNAIISSGIYSRSDILETLDDIIKCFSDNFSSVSMDIPYLLVDTSVGLSSVYNADKLEYEWDKEVFVLWPKDAMTDIEPDEVAEDYWECEDSSKWDSSQFYPRDPSKCDDNCYYCTTKYCPKRA